MSEQVVEFVELINHPDYEILNKFPFTIRKKSNHYEICESIESNGYVQVKLNAVSYLKHILIAKQFLVNDDAINKTEVDHINHDRIDYHIENLRWITHRQNCKNKSSNCGVEYTFVDDIDGDSIVVTDYGKHEFEEYYYDQKVDKFYFWNGVKYRELHINEKKNGSLFVHMMSTENKKVCIYISKFKKLYGLI